MIPDDFFIACAAHKFINGDPVVYRAIWLRWVDRLNKPFMDRLRAKIEEIQRDKQG